MSAAKNMRMDLRFTRTRDWLTAPEVPRLESGGVALCHVCQRRVYFAKGFLRLLTMGLERVVRTPGSRHWSVFKKLQQPIEG